MKLLKKSDGEADIKISLDGKNCEAFEVSLEDTASGMLCDGSSEILCQMSKAHELEMHV